MRVKILKTKAGQRTEIIGTYNSVIEAKKQLDKFWMAYKDKWDNIGYFEGFSSSGKILNYDVYRYEIVNAKGVWQD